MRFTLVSTVYNEINRLDDSLADLSNQTLQPSEVVIVDAGSNDGTYQRLQQWQQVSAVPIILLQKVKCNVAEGRNLAIRNATYNIIASTDFGCRFHPRWLEKLMAPFQDSSVEAVAGTSTVIEADIQSLSAKAAYIWANAYLPANLHNFIPSSRSVAFCKEVFENIGGYCEWLTLAADDTVFGMLALKRGHVFQVVREPYVYWGRHSRTSGYAKEAFRYGLGEGEAHIGLRGAVSTLVRNLMRLFFWILLLPVLLLVSIGTISAWWLLLPLLLTPAFQNHLGYTRNFLRLRSAKYSLGVFMYGFYLFERVRWNYLKGYCKGYFFSPGFRKKEAEKLHTLFKAADKNIIVLQPTE